MPLPECQCVAGQPTQQQLGAIYCALLEVIAGQGGGPTIDPAWSDILEAPPTPEAFLITNSVGVLQWFTGTNSLATFAAGGNIEALGISDAGRLLVQIATPPASSIIVVGDDGTVSLNDAASTAVFLAGGQPVFTGTAGGIALTEGTAVNGILTDLQGT